MDLGDNAQEKNYDRRIITNYHGQTNRDLIKLNFTITSIVLVLRILLSRMLFCLFQQSLTDSFAQLMALGFMRILLEQPRNQRRYLDQHASQVTLVGLLSKRDHFFRYEILPFFIVAAHLLCHLGLDLDSCGNLHLEAQYFGLQIPYPHLGNRPYAAFSRRHQ